MTDKNLRAAMFVARREELPAADRLMILEALGIVAYGGREVLGDDTRKNTTRRAEGRVVKASATQDVRVRPKESTAPEALRNAKW